MRYSASNPFIGKLVLKFLEVSHTKHGKTLFLWPAASPPMCWHLGAAYCSK